MGDPQFFRTITVMPVSDIDPSATWYQQTLRFETVYLHEGDQEDEPTNFAVFRREGLTVDLILDDPTFFNTKVHDIADILWFGNQLCVYVGLFDILQ